MTVNIDILQDLHSEILVRLPVKSLLRFRCVSKSWNSLITSSDFITKHIIHNTANNNVNALIRMYFTDSRVAKFTLHSENESLDKILDIEFPEDHFQEFFFIIGCVNGLVCLTDSYQRTNTLLLWNPMIRKYLTLVKPDDEATLDLTDLSMGFGFDIRGNDYKYVRIHRVEGLMTMDLVRLSTQQWIEVDVPTSLPRFRGWIAAYFSGVLHWVANSDHLIVGFDLGLETFTEIELPRELNRTSSNSVWDGLTILEWRGSLAVVEREDGLKYCLWAMREYGVAQSWNKQFVVAGFGGLNNVRTNGQMMFYDREFTYVDSYDPETKRTRHDVLRLEEPLNMLQMTPYIESLVLVDKGTSYTLDQ